MKRVLKRIPRSALITLSLCLAWLVVFGLPRVGPGRYPAGLDKEIAGLMDEIVRQYPDPEMDTKVESIAERWAGWERSPMPGLLALGPGALPYVEQMMRSKDPKRRLIGYRMLIDVRRGSEIPSRYRNPIWERALYDELPEIRRRALWGLGRDYFGWRGIRVYYRLMRDPDMMVRVMAARKLYSYNLRFLVPLRLQYEERQAGTWNMRS